MPCICRVTGDLNLPTQFLVSKICLMSNAYRGRSSKASKPHPIHRKLHGSNSPIYSAYKQQYLYWPPCNGTAYSKSISAYMTRLSQRSPKSPNRMITEQQTPCGAPLDDRKYRVWSGMEGGDASMALFQLPHHHE